MFLNKFVSLLLVISVITLSVFSGVETLTVTVTKNPDDDGALRITTAADVSTPENTDKVITLITNKSDTNVFKNMLTIFTGFKSRGFES
jgi:hypothetical protein